MGRKPAVTFLAKSLKRSFSMQGFRARALDALGGECQPSIAPVIAVGRQAVQASKLDAVDYLLRPSNKLRFSKTVPPGRAA